MRSNFNSLIAAWALSLILLIGGILYIELQDSPAPQKLHSANHAENPSPKAERSETEAPKAHASTEDAAHDPSNTPTETAANDHNIDDHDRPLTTLPRPKINDSHDQAISNRPHQNEQAPAPGETNQGHSNQADSQTAATILPPNEALLEQTTAGPLPKIGPDGTKPGHYYRANSHVQNDKPRIALLISEMGLRSKPSMQALTDLPGAISFAFSPYASGLSRWGDEARKTQHEYFLMLPLEPINYPQNDPGPMALFSDHTIGQNLELLRAVMGRTTGYAGLASHMGSRFTADSQSLRPILEEIGKRGLLFIDAHSTPHTRAAQMAETLGIEAVLNDRYIDNDLATADIADQLNELENKAKVTGAALGIARPYPVSITTIKKWAEGLEERGFQLVPVSQIIGYQKLH